MSKYNNLGFRIGDFVKRNEKQPCPYLVTDINMKKAIILETIQSSFDVFQRKEIYSLIRIKILEHTEGAWIDYSFKVEAKYFEFWKE